MVELDRHRERIALAGAPHHPLMNWVFALVGDGVGDAVAQVVQYAPGMAL